MKKHFNKFCAWHEGHCERMRKLLNLTHMQHLWISFVKGVVFGILLMCLISCTTTTATDVAKPKPRPSTIQNIDAIGKVLGCMFAPSSEECEELRKKSKEQPNFEDQ